MINGLLKGVDKSLEPLANVKPFLSTDLAATPQQIIGWFVSRWRMETTFQEARIHLGMETQQQWSDLAILRPTPSLLGFLRPKRRFSLATCAVSVGGSPVLPSNTSIATGRPWRSHSRP